MCYIVKMPRRKKHTWQFPRCVRSQENPDRPWQVGSLVGLTKWRGETGETPIFSTIAEIVIQSVQSVWSSSFAVVCDSASYRILLQDAGLKEREVSLLAPPVHPSHPIGCSAHPNAAHDV